MYIIWNINSKDYLINDINEIIKNQFVNNKYVLWRNPENYQSKFNKSYWNIDPNISYDEQIYKAQLTDIGKKYCEYRGNELYTYYKNDFDFNILSKDEIIINSSYLDRTIDSAIYFLKSFNLTKNNINIIDELFYTKIFNSDELYNYDKITNEFKLDIDTTELDKNILDILGHTVLKSMDYFDIYNTINCYKVHNYELPDDINKINDIIDEMSVIFYNEYNDVTNIYAKILASNLLNYIINIITSNIKFAFLSTHDNMIMPLIKLLAFNHNIKETLFHIPNFCSTIRFEVWNDNIIRIYYDSIFLTEYNI